MHSDGYYFGTTLAKRIDYFAFPRTGSHFLWTSLTGMLDRLASLFVSWQLRNVAIECQLSPAVNATAWW